MSATAYAEYLDAAANTDATNHLGVLVFSTVRSAPATHTIDGAKVTLPPHSGVTPDTLKESFRNAGLDEKFLRPVPSPINAFKNATGKRTTCTYNDPKETELHFVSVSKRGSEKETRHLMRTVVDRERGQAKVTECVAEMVFYQAGSNLPGVGGHSVKVNVLTHLLSDKEQFIVAEFLFVVQARFHELLTYYTPEALRWTIRDQINSLNAIRVGGNNSACYFVHRDRTDKVTALSVIIEDEFAAGSSVHLVPLIDNAYQRDRLTVAFGEQVEAEAAALIDTISQATVKANQAGGIKMEAYAKLRREYQDALARAEEHVRLLDKAQTVGGAALEAVQDVLDALALQVV